MNENEQPVTEEIVVPPEATELTDEATPVEDDKILENAAKEEDLKKFSQDEVNRIVQKRLAEERRKAEREAEERVREAVLHRSREDFSDENEYEEHVKELEIQRRVQMSIKQTEFKRKLDQTREKFSDFDEVVKNLPTSALTKDVAEAILDAENGPELIYYLGLNPEELEQVASKTGTARLLKLGEIHSGLSENLSKIKKQSNAPEPIVPLSSKRSGPPTVYDTTKPEAASNLDPSEWMELERKRIISKLSKT